MMIFKDIHSEILFISLEKRLDDFVCLYMHKGWTYEWHFISYLLYI
jgi:hypothetical protein